MYIYTLIDNLLYTLYPVVPQYDEPSLSMCTFTLCMYMHAHNSSSFDAINFVSQATDLSTSRLTPIMNPVMNPLHATPDTQPRPHAPPISQPSGGQGASAARRKVRKAEGNNLILTCKHLDIMMKPIYMNSLASSTEIFSDIVIVHV